MNVSPGRVADPINCVGHRQHVIGQCSLQASLLSLRRAEVDDPRVDAVVAEDRHSTRRR